MNYVSITSQLCSTVKRSRGTIAQEGKKRLLQEFQPDWCWTTCRYSKGTLYRYGGRALKLLYHRSKIPVQYVICTCTGIQPYMFWHYTNVTQEADERLPMA